MSKLTHKKLSAERRAYRVRSKVIGTAKRPRLSVFISNIHVSAQIIDDSKSLTLAYATTVGAKQAGSMTDKASWVGQQIAQKAKTAKVKKVVLDRGPRQYHGRVKALAEAARETGLEF